MLNIIIFICLQCKALEKVVRDKKKEIPFSGREKAGQNLQSCDRIMQI